MTWRCMFLLLLLAPSAARAVCCAATGHTCAEVPAPACVTPSVGGTCPDGAFNSVCPGSSCEPTGPTETPTDTFTWTPTRTATPTDTPSTQAGVDCTSQFAAVYNFNSASTPFNPSGGTCGANCNLTAGSGTTRDTSVKIEGTASAHFDGTGNSTLSCNTSTCSALLLTGDQMVVAWGYSTAAADTGIVSTYDGSGHGLYLDRTNGNGKGRFLTYNNSTSNASFSADSSFTASAWHHLVGVYTASGTHTQLYFDGVPENDVTALALTQSSAGTLFRVGTVSSGFEGLTGNVDELAVRGGLPSNVAAAACYYCACGIDGSGCTRTGSSFVSTGLRVSNCSSCTMPADASVCP